MNKPVITFNGSAERNHIDILGDAGIYYSDYNSLVNILMNISVSDIKDKNWNRYTDFTPTKVMAQFNKIFLQ
jgi:hypothetical protein